jgi:putative ABC transport system permease protein
VRVVEQAQTATGGEFILPSIEVSTRRVFLDPPVVDAALTPRASLLNNRRDRPNDGQEGLLEASYVTNGAPVLTYLANAITHGDRLTPYSMIAAADVPWTPPGMADDEIIVTDWLAEDLGLSRGDRVDVVYFDPEAGAQLIERTNQFRVAGIVPLRGIHADRTLMPDFPGLANAETTSDWDAGFPLKHTIREKDEAYWQQHRGTPKAFVTYETGRRLWGNRFGNATAIRFPVPEQGFPAPFKRVVEENLLANLRPADLGLVFQPVREQAFAAATSGQDFGGLFLGFSFFLIAAALLLMALLFQFGLEQRLPEVGTFLALGFQRATVRRLWIGEGALLALLGGILGVIGGVIYARAMIHGLTTIWSDAVAGANLDFHATPQSLALGFVASSLVAAITIAWTLRRQFSRPARALLSRDLGEGRLLQRSRGRLIAIIAAALAAGLVLWAIATRQTASAGVFFGAGALCVVAGIAFASWILTRLQPAATGAAPSDALTPSGLALRGATRRRSRSLATISLLASGAFLIAAIGAFRMDAHQDPWRRSSGTGGFAFIGETSLPVSQDLNTAHGLEFFALSPEDAPGVSFVPLRVLEGDDASCLNLNRAQRPRILGVHPEDLARRNAFRFAALAKGIDVTNGWLALKASAARSQTPAEDAVPEIPAIGDAASIQWALGKKIGDTLELADAQGRPFRLRLVGGVANSILQGNLIIDEARFRRLFPDVAGYRLFLIDAPTNNLDAVAATFSRAMEDVGLELTPPTTRLAQFNAVQNTYLTTFQILGGLGLLLGSAGLGVVVLRNVLERRGELALLTAVGFRRNQLSRWVLWEHASLLMAGLVIGVISAAIAVLPSMLSPTAELPAASLLWTLAGVLALGMITTWLATRASMRGRLLDALRGE